MMTWKRRILCLTLAAYGSTTLLPAAETSRLDAQRQVVAEGRITVAPGSNNPPASFRPVPAAQSTLGAAGGAGLVVRNPSFEAGCVTGAARLAAPGRPEATARQGFAALERVPCGEIVPPEWELAFRDEFDGNRLDRDKWELLGNDTETVMNGARARESLGTVKFDGQGHCVFTCEKDDQGVWQFVQFLQARHRQSYGYFESRIRMGADPALVSSGFWLYSDGPQGNPLTKHIEIDILENQNLKMNCTLHFALTEPYYRVFSHTLPAPPKWDEWRVFGCQWTPHEIIFYLDGQETYRFDYKTYGVTALKPLFAVIGGGGTKPSFLKLDQVPLPDRERLYPVFDYVRIYQARKMKEPAPGVVLSVGAGAPRPDAEGYRLVAAGTKVNFAVAATPAAGIESVALIDNGFLVAERTAPPYEFPVQFTPEFFNGTQFLVANRNTWTGDLTSKPKARALYTTHAFTALVRTSDGRVGIAAPESFYLMPEGYGRLEIKDAECLRRAAKTGGEDTVRGRYVRIEKDRGILSLAEVQVLRGGTNLAARGTATQSTTYVNANYGGAAVAGRATDGNTDGDYAKGSVSSTVDDANAPNPWWELDLGTDRDLARVIIWNRTEACAERLDGTRVVVLDAQRQVVAEGRITVAPGRNNPPASFRPVPAAQSTLGAAGSAGLVVRNPSFEAGAAGKPEGWTGAGTVEWGSGPAADGQRYASLRGVDPKAGDSRSGDGAWRSVPVAFQPGEIYELRLKCRCRPETLFSGGNAVIGTGFVLRVLPAPTDVPVSQWQVLTSRFMAPGTADAARSPIALSQWALTGWLDVDAVAVLPVKLAHAAVDRMLLGEGESIAGNAYEFRAPYDRSANVSRPLHGYQAFFHDNRWRLNAADDYVVYRHELAGRKLLSAAVTLDLWWEEGTSHKVRVEAGTATRGLWRCASVRC